MFVLQLNVAKKTANLSVGVGLLFFKAVTTFARFPFAARRPFNHIQFANRLNVEKALGFFYCVYNITLSKKTQYFLKKISNFVYVFCKFCTKESFCRKIFEKFSKTTSKHFTTLKR